MTLHDNLVKLLAHRSARRGNFTLSSGKQSNLYIDARLTTMSPEGLVLIGALGLEAINASGWNVKAVGGLTLGADPIAYAISYASARTPSPLRAFTVRKAAKEHGTQQLIEGPFQSGDVVAIVEDVITTGDSALRAIQSVQNAGGIIAGVLALVDREERGRQKIEAHHFPVVCLATASEVLAQIPC
ncbi:MAG: orotate phosphoribosyltransferase [Gemmatimonadaceae bacterium]|nr:orotate phosphoribosyltransferase [Gemmatimonadaceae bacterium]